jgi:hypothetical protein
MSSSEAPTSVEITRWTVYGAEACLPPETLLDSPRVQTSDRFMQKWPRPKTRAPSSNADGNPGSGPSPTASTKPIRAPQLTFSWKDPSRWREYADPGVTILL